MRLKHNKRLLNALNANQLSAKWKVPAEDAGEVVAKKMRMPWPEIHATEVEEKKKKLRKMGVAKRMLPVPLGSVSHPQDSSQPHPLCVFPFSPNNDGQLLLNEVAFPGYFPAPFVSNSPAL